MKGFGAVLLATTFAVLGIATQARAISLSTAFKAPLTTPYVVCGTEQSTTDCTTGSMELDSPWRFSAGTIEIDDNEVSLRLDDLQLADGLDCDVDVASGACNCWDDPNNTCGDDTDCLGTEECGPMGNVTTDNNYFKVKIFMQDRFEYGGPQKIRRDTNCHPEVNFDLKAVNPGNMNRQVNQTVTVNIESCGLSSEAHGVEIRHVEVLDKWGNRVAMPTH